MCVCSGVMEKGLPPQVEAEGVYGELREWLPAPSSSCRLLRRPGEPNTWRTLKVRIRVRWLVWRAVGMISDSGRVRLLTGAVSVGGRRSAVARTGEEGGQAGQVRVLAGEEGLPIVSWGQQAGL